MPFVTVLVFMRVNSLLSTEGMAPSPRHWQAALTPCAYHLVLDVHMLACTGSAVGVRQKVTEAMKRTAKHLLIAATVLPRDSKMVLLSYAQIILHLFFTISSSVSISRPVCWSEKFDSNSCKHAGLQIY